MIISITIDAYNQDNANEQAAQKQKDQASTNQGSASSGGGAPQPENNNDDDKYKESQKTEDILNPKNELVGEVRKGATDNIRTVSKENFQKIKETLINDAKPTETPETYAKKGGQYYERSDGVKFGIRQSQNSGETIDIINGHNQNLPKNLKIHYN